MSPYDPAPARLHSYSWIGATQLLRAAEHHGISPWQVCNYATLAQGLLTYGASYQHFDMGRFLVGSDGRDLLPHDAVNWNYCGTAACAVGHAPQELNVPGLPEEDWGEYMLRVFGGETSLLNVARAHNTQLATWCFDSHWIYGDNTMAGAANRIKAALLRPGVVQQAVELCASERIGDLPYRETDPLWPQLLALYQTAEEEIPVEQES